MIIIIFNISNIFKNAEYLDDNNFIFNLNKKIDVVDIYLYKNLDTYVYKYNFINIIDKEYTIHDNHINHYVSSTNFQIKEIINNILYLGKKYLAEIKNQNNKILCYYKKYNNCLVKIYIYKFLKIYKYFRIIKMFKNKIIKFLVTYSNKHSQN